MLLFNSAVSEIDKTDECISKHLMLLFNKKKTTPDKVILLISKHLMLLFNQSGQQTMGQIYNFKTSHVIV